MIAYFDTSAVVKSLLDERGRREAAAMWLAADHKVASRLLYPEGRAALAAAARAGRISAAELPRVRDRLRDRVERMDIVELDEVLAEAAGELAERHALRAYDAVHLASALAVEEAVMVTWDAGLAGAATDAGLRVLTG